MTDAALSDLRVLDLAGEIGVYATKLLADLGADVIRIEHPDGDPLRDIGPFWHDEAAADRSLSFLNNNTNKRSITLDIAQPEGRALFEKLVATADVVVETFAPGYLDSIGLGYAALCKIKPDIILTSVTGFGQDGPHSHYRWSDVVGVAMSGMMTLAGDKDDPPNMPVPSQGYTGASIQAAAGTMMAVVHRDNSGEGQHIDVSMQEANSINQETAMQTYDMTKEIRRRTGSRGAIPIDIAGIGVYECTDGQVFSYLGTPGGAPWTAMLDWMNREGMAEDLNDEPYVTLIRKLQLSFLTALARPDELQKHLDDFGGRVKSVGELLPLLMHLHQVFGRFCASMSKWTLYEEGQKQRLMFGIVSTPEDLAKNPQLAARGWYQDVRHDHLGATVRYAGPPYRLSETPWSLRRRPPLPGEHNIEVYVEELGVPAGEVERLRAAGVV
jgi:crotonobetainyl-CoA:carnitine CoA-transferase CaiB-like acyl-CoA transferase